MSTDYEPMGSVIEKPETVVIGTSPQTVVVGTSTSPFGVGISNTGRPASMMSFTDSIRICFRKYFDFKGRASRSEFWWFTLFLVCVGTVTGTIDALLFGWEFSDPTPLTNIATIVTLIPSFSVSWRRLHDVGKSGWWNLISLTIIGLIPLIIWCIRASDNPNQYGEIPTNYLN